MADHRYCLAVGLAGKGRAVGVGEVKFRDITPAIKRVRYE